MGRITAISLSMLLSISHLTAAMGTQGALHDAAKNSDFVSAIDSGESSRELIVLLGRGRDIPTPEEIILAVRLNRPLPSSLGLGTPAAARFLIPDRDRGVNSTMAPDSPAGLLARYIVLSYPLPVDLAGLVIALRHNPSVLFAAENRSLHLAILPNDPFFAPPPGTPTPDQYEWGSYSLRLPEAWDYNQGHAYIGVIDIGLAVQHPDLRTFHRDAVGNWVFDHGSYRPQFAFDYGYPDEGPNCPGDPNPSLTCADEGQTELVSGTLRAVSFTGHGTHVSGIIGATPNNDTDVAGACWSCSLIASKISILSCNHLGCANTTTTQANVVAGINGAIARGAQVLNLSLGYRASDSPPAPDCQASPYDPFCVALQLAEDRDVAIVAAAGNDDSSQPDFPASDSREIGVAGIDSTGEFWNDCGTSSFECGSNYSPAMIEAPAKQILSTFYPGIPYGGSTCPGNAEVGPCTGTSMASPYMAGSVGILRSVNPLLSKTTIKALLTGNLENPPDWNPANGLGKPNLGATVRAAQGIANGAVIPNRLTPLFSLYSAYVEDSFYTTVPQMAVAARYGSGGYQSYGPLVPGYPSFPQEPCVVSPCEPVQPRSSVYLFTGVRAPYSGAPPLVPLYRMSFSGVNPNGNANHRDTTYTTADNGVLAFKQVGYELDGIEGYIYARCTSEPDCIPTGAVRLYRRYNPQRDDFAIFPESELASMESQGYTSTGDGNEILGYAYPNTDTDGDDVIDGFEGLAGTNPLAIDSDGDNLSDGAEILAYPSSDPLGTGCSAATVWVSAGGNDANSCSRATPCRTFAGALGKVCSRGEIHVMDSGDYASATINKSVSLIATGVLGGLHVSSGTGLTINAGPNDKVLLRGLTFDGVGTGLSGVTFTAGGTLYIESCTFDNFSQYAVDFAPTSGSGRLFVSNTLFRGNGIGSNGGALHLSSASAPGFLATVEGLRSENNVFGLKAENYGLVTVRNSIAAGNGYSGFSAVTPFGASALRMVVEDSASIYNGTNAFLASGATMTLSNTIATGNLNGFAFNSGGSIISFGNNKFQYNATNGAPTLTISSR